MSLVRSGHEAQIKSVRKTKFRLRSNVTNFPAWQTDFSFGAQLCHVYLWNGGHDSLYGT